MAKARGYMMTEKDRDEVREMLRWWRHRPPTPRTIQFLPPEPDPQAPDVYVCLSPEAGIPALTDAYYYGDRTGTGSGTSFSGTGDRPGSAECEVYEILPNEAGSPRLYPTGQSRQVYNLSRCAIPGWQWIKATRDKYGAWVADYRPCGDPPNPSPDGSTGTGTGTGTTSGGGGDGTVITKCCSPLLLPAALYVTFSGGTGTLLSVTGTYAMECTVTSPNQEWFTVPMSAASGEPFRLRCEDMGSFGQWCAGFVPNCNAPAGGTTCNPLHISGTTSITGGSVNYDIVETF